MTSRLNILWAVPVGLITFALVEILVFLPLFLLGLVVVPLALRLAPTVQVPSRLWPVTITTFRSKVLDELWGNHEDGILAGWWAAKGGSAWTWFLRNPISNMRFWPVISTRPVPARVRYIGSPTIPPDGTPCCFLAWQGPFVGFRWQSDTRGLWIGWAVNPSDSQGMPNDWRAFGYSTVLQILRF